ncbi:MAG: 30S ribosomal protein S6 [Candidatus Izemoplasmataceae bacterium]
MRKYEIMYIIRPNLLEEDRKKLIESLNDIFSSMDSEVTKVNEWGMRDLAYEIQDFKKGYYVVLDVKATEEARAEFDRIIRLKEEVIRYLIIKDER